MERELAFSRGARGFIVSTFQQALAAATGLSLVVDGVFGSATERALFAFHSESNQATAGAKEFAALALPWPDEFVRAIALVSVLEGTSFGDMNATDIDGAGVTLGIAGFTTASGEVQELFAHFFSADPAAADLLGREDRNLLFSLLKHGSSRAAWDAFFYSHSGTVKIEIARAMVTWGTRSAMRSCQLEMARQRFWKSGVVAADRLGFKTPRARLFFLDVAVQNGGWRAGHQVLAERLVGFHSPEECDRLEAAAHAVAACAKARWRDDVLQRKLALAHGEGSVHGISIDLRVQAIE
jgi:hypothetical protein